MPNLTLAGLNHNAIRVGGRTYTDSFPEAAGQVFKAGELLAIDSAGRCLLFVAVGSSLDTDGNHVLGFAVEAATGTTDNRVAVEVITGETEITMPQYNTTAGTSVTAQTDLDLAYPLINETTGGLMLNINTTTKGIARKIRNAASYDGVKATLGDQYGPVVVKVINAARFDQS